MNRLTRYHALAFMVLCLLVAAALRLPALPQAPPGLHYDEAANAILSADIGLNGSRPVFISSYTGKEPLFFYLAGGLMRLVGVSVFTLRLTAAYTGLLTVAATYWLGREMLADRRVAILAAALLGVSFWHVLFSRLGFRAISQPLLQALVVAALFRGLRSNDRRWIVAGGLFLGAAAYTYLAVRVFPILLLLGLLPFLFERDIRRLRLTQLALFFGAALLVLLPLLLYFLANPDAFWVRIGQVAPDANMARLTLQDSIIKSLSMFFLKGDPFWRFNLPERPLFNWFWGGLLVVGWLVAVWRWRRFPYAWQRSALTILIVAPLVMLLPTALATGEIVPSNLRAIGLIPFIFFLPAIGVVILLHDLEKRFHFPPVTFAVLFIGLLVLLSGGLSTWQAYYETWASAPTLLYEADGDLAAVAQFLDETNLADKTLYVAAPHYQHPTVAFLSRNYDAVKWLPQSQALVFPADGGALIVYPYNSPAPGWARPYLETADSVTTGEPEDAFSAYTFDKTPPISLEQTTDVNFGDVISLRGYDVQPESGQNTLPLMLLWQVENIAAADFAPFMHLEDEWGQRWSQVETFAYPAAQWTPGETILQQAALPLPPGLPPGNYQLRVGLFDSATNSRLPRLDEDGRFAGDSLVIENVTLSGAPLPAAIPTPPFEVGETVRPGLRLVGYERGPLTVATGAPFGVALWWQARENLPHMELEFVLRDSAGNGRVVHTSQPVHNAYPFEAWRPPEFIIDRQTLRLPDDMPTGDFRLQLHINEAGEPIYSTDLGPIEVQQTERRFTLPETANSLDAIFGDEIGLRGYDLAENDAGIYELTLVWQALGAPTDDYIVFVHALNPDGTCCVWQQDVTPLQNQYPTSRWLPGEVVVDPYRIDLPAGLPPDEYPIEVGLYIGATGQRLVVMQSGMETGDVVVLRPLTPGSD